MVKVCVYLSESTWSITDHFNHHTGSSTSGTDHFTPVTEPVTPLLLSVSRERKLFAFNTRLLALILTQPLNAASGQSTHGLSPLDGTESWKSVGSEASISQRVLLVDK